jgi:hypothetical protein
MKYKHLFSAVLIFFSCNLLTGQEPAAPSTGPITVPTERPSPLKISGNLEICKGSETILKAEGEFESFTWEKSGVSGRLLRVKEEGQYEVTAVTKQGCRYTASVNVRVRPCS